MVFPFRWRRFRLVALLLASIACVGCTKPERQSADAGASATNASPTSVIATSSALDANLAPPPPRPAPPRGSARLVIEHVESVGACGVHGEMHRAAIGDDVIVETQDEGEQKPLRDHVFCSKRLPDGGVAKMARLGTWQNCRENQVCKVLTSEAGDDIMEVACGKDHVTLVVEGGRTILRGPFGDREIAPFPMRIDATKRTTRSALVDC